MQAGGYRFDPGYLHQSNSFLTNAVTFPGEGRRDEIFDNRRFANRVSAILHVPGSPGTENCCQCRFAKHQGVRPDFSGQATKGAWGMPWRQKAMKDVVSCDKPRGAANKL